MERGTPIRRLTLVPSSASGESVRRYRLARLDEVALATPPDPSAEKRMRARRAPGADGSDGLAAGEEAV